MAIQSKEILTEDGRQYHIRVKKGEIGKYVILPGDPFRTDIIAEYLDNPVLVAHNREHKTWTGTLDGEKVSVTSTGMGGGSAAIAVEELIHAGAEVLIRVGTCGSICKESWDPKYDGCVVTGAVRQEGTTLHYVPVEYPAIPDRDVTSALSQAVAERGYTFTEGIVQSKDSFYGQHDPESMPNSDYLNSHWKAWEKAGVMASEMECAAVFVVSMIRGAKAGAVLAYKKMNEHTLNVVIDAVKILIEKDRENSK